MTGSKRRVGRPAEQRQQAVRRQLVDAARELFSQRGFEAVSLREVAQAAGVTPAMVHYYFGGRHGLWKAVLEDTLEDVLQAMRDAREDIEAPGGLAVYLRRHAATLGANPWLAPLLYREIVLAGPSVDFVDRFPARLRALLGGAIEQARARGEIDPALDPRLVLLSLIAAAVFPFVFRPLVEMVLDMPIDAGFAALWADHAQRLFYEGARP